MCELGDLEIVGGWEDGSWRFSAACTVCDWEAGATINVGLAQMDANRHVAETGTGPETDLADGEAFEPTGPQLATLKSLRTAHPDVEVVAILRGAVRVRVPLEGMAHEQWITGDGGQVFCGDGSLPDGPG